MSRTADVPPVSRRRVLGVRGQVRRRVQGRRSGWRRCRSRRAISAEVAVADVPGLRVNVVRCSPAPPRRTSRSRSSRPRRRSRWRPGSGPSRSGRWCPPAAVPAVVKVQAVASALPYRSGALMAASQRGRVLGFAARSAVGSRVAIRVAASYVTVAPTLRSCRAGLERERRAADTGDGLGERRRDVVTDRDPGGVGPPASGPSPSAWWHPAQVVGLLTLLPLGSLDPRRREGVAAEGPGARLPVDDRVGRRRAEVGPLRGVAAAVVLGRSPTRASCSSCGSRTAGCRTTVLWSPRSSTLLPWFARGSSL